MRVLVVLLLVSLVGCKSSRKAPEEPAASANPYHNVMPEKFKQKVEDIQKKSEDKSDKLLENAK
ncbi:MAG: hypothetical protein JWN44_5159 [Myxococcales bacterium]|nr:hypothetical protein [Myxococcales bacterium]